ncbi:MAG: hypothetical protein WC451_02150 [Patescibacteria group bacterium]
MDKMPQPGEVWRNKVTGMSSITVVGVSQTCLGKSAVGKVRQRRIPVVTVIDVGSLPLTMPLFPVYSDEWNGFMMTQRMTPGEVYLSRQ